jgi:hypothetical protein
VEDALARLPQDIERKKEHLIRAHQQLDKATVYYEAALGVGPAPEFVAKHTRFSSPTWRRWRNYRRDLTLPVAEENYRTAERHVNHVHAHIAELEARLVKLQEISGQECSNQGRIRGYPPLGTTTKSKERSRHE